MKSREDRGVESSRSHKADIGPVPALAQGRTLRLQFYRNPKFRSQLALPTLR